MEYFNTHISALTIVFLALAFAAACVSAIVGMRHLRSVARYGRRAEKQESDLLAIPDDKLPSATVVVYTRNAEDYLRDFVKSLESQNYPKFDIVIVNDGSTDMTREVTDNLIKEYPNIKYTFVSDTAKNVSRVKVAYTLGIKASDNEVIVTTAANCRPVSDNWLRLLCAPLSNPRIGVSLGYSYVPSEIQTDKGRYSRAFDSTLASAQWLGAGLEGKTFRGDQYNLAFRRKLFFDNKGYASSTALNGGHDDIFINEIASRTESSVCLHPDASVEVDWDPSQIQRLYRDARERRLFAARFLRKDAFRLQGLNSACIYAMLGFIVAAIAITVPNLFTVVLSAGIIILFWGYQICVYRRTSEVLKTMPIIWSVPLRWLIRPITTLLQKEHGKNANAKHYTWSVGMKP